MIKKGIAAAILLFSIIIFTNCEAETSYLIDWLSNQNSDEKYIQGLSDHIMYPDHTETCYDMIEITLCETYIDIHNLFLAITCKLKPDELNVKRTLILNPNPDQREINFSSDRTFLVWIEPWIRDYGAEDSFITEEIDTNIWLQKSWCHMPMDNEDVDFEIVQDGDVELMFHVRVQIWSRGGEFITELQFIFFHTCKVSSNTGTCSFHGQLKIPHANSVLQDLVVYTTPFDIYYEIESTALNPEKDESAFYYVQNIDGESLTRWYDHFYTIPDRIRVVIQERGSDFLPVQYIFKKEGDQYIYLYREITQKP